MSEPPVRVKMEGALQPKRRAKLLVVGLDFGTTFSGAAWKVHYRHRKNTSECEPKTVRAWPSSHGPDQDESKVPSRLQYDGQGEVKAWGYEVGEGDGIIIDWPKLAIVPEKDLAPHLRDSSKLKETRKHIQDLRITETEVIAQYIDKLWTHAQGEIKKSVGRRDFENMPIHVVITIPAIWGNHEIARMKDAAAVSILQSRTAGPTTYEFLSEPEAAVQAYARQLQDKLDENDTFMVLDIGGGTADAICYEKVGEGEECLLELEEAAPGDGALCGAVFVDEAFEARLLSKLSANHRDLKTEDPNAWRRIIAEQWQHSIKRSFKWNASGQIWPVILSNISSKVDAVRMHEDEIRDIFEGSVMPSIINLVKRQIKQVKKTHHGKGPRIILPVGGFGRCPYVLQRLREEFEGGSTSTKRIKNGGKKKRKLNCEEIEIHSETGEMPWTSVCRGACQFGMRAQLNNCLVTSRSARDSVGFYVNVPGLAEEGGVWMPNFDEYMIPDVMNWIVKKGDPISSRGKKSTETMSLGCDPTVKGLRFERSVLYAYDGDPAPERFDEKDARFREYGVMEITSTKPIEKLPVKPSATGGKVDFDYNLEIEIVGGSVQLSAISAYSDDKGKEVGKLLLPELDTM